MNKTACRHIGAGCPRSLAFGDLGLHKSQTRALPSVIIRAAQVVAAMRADQLAPVARQAMRTGWANLAVMLDRQIRVGIMSGAIL